MPKGFSEHAKAQIRSALLEKGRTYFETRGLQQTSIENLARAAGISKGAFYLFYTSKEELFFDILRQIEADYRTTILAAIPGTAGTAHQRMKQLLGTAVQAWQENALLATFHQDAYAFLLRKVPEEKIRSHLRDDEAFIAALIARLSTEGIVVERDPRLVTGLIRALFYVALHRNDISQNTFPAVLEVLLNLVAGYLVQVPDGYIHT